MSDIVSTIQDDVEGIGESTVAMLGIIYKFSRSRCVGRVLKKLDEKQSFDLFHY